MSESGQRPIDIAPTPTESMQFLLAQQLHNPVVRAAFLAGEHQGWTREETLAVMAAQLLAVVKSQERALTRAAATRLVTPVPRAIVGDALDAQSSTAEVPR